MFWAELLVVLAMLIISSKPSGNLFSFVKSVPSMSQKIILIIKSPPQKFYAQNFDTKNFFPVQRKTALIQLGIMN